MRISDLHPGDRFRANVTIPLVGAPPTTINFTFRYRNGPALKIFCEKMSDGDGGDSKALEDVLVGWDLEDEFNADNLRALVEHLPEAAVAILTTYLRESGMKGIPEFRAK